MIWVILVGVVCFVVGFILGKRRCVKRGSQISQIDADSLEGDEKRVYDILVREDGVGFFAKIADEEGFGRDRLGEIVSGLVSKGVVEDKKYKRFRKIYLRNFLRKDDRLVVGFLKKKGGEGDFGDIMKGLSMDDDRLWKVGKRLVRTGVIVKVSRGYRTFFVLK